MILVMKNVYDPTSFQVLRDWVRQSGGEIVSPRQVAYVTSCTSFADRLFRQRVTETRSHTLLVETALVNSGGNPLHKVYYHALEPSMSRVRFRTLPRQRPGHYVYRVNSGDWLAVSSLFPY